MAVEQFGHLGGRQQGLGLRTAVVGGLGPQPLDACSQPIARIARCVHNKDSVGEVETPKPVIRCGVKRRKIGVVREWAWMIAANGATFAGS